jgi:hypothetical protein
VVVFLGRAAIMTSRLVSRRESLCSKRALPHCSCWKTRRRDARVEKDTRRRAVAPERTRRTAGRRLRSARTLAAAAAAGELAVEAVLPLERRKGIRRRKGKISEGATWLLT